MNNEDAEAILSFLGVAEKLKTQMRHSWTSEGRQESVAEHTWRAALLAMLLEEHYPDVDINRVIRMLLVHDLGEATEGDVPAFVRQENEQDHVDAEENAVKQITKVLSESQQKHIQELWKEFHETKTPEAKLAMAIDKIEVIIQHNEADISHWIDKEYPMAFTHGKEYMQFDNTIKQFRKTVDGQSKKKILSERPEKLPEGI